MFSWANGLRTSGRRNSRTIILESKHEAAGTAGLPVRLHPLVMQSYNIVAAIHVALCDNVNYGSDDSEYNKGNGQQSHDHVNGWFQHERSFGVDHPLMLAERLDERIRKS